MIEKVVYDRFNQQIKLEVAHLIGESIKHSIESYKYSQLFGVCIGVSKEPLTFHIGAISKELVDNLVIIFDDENGGTKKDNS